MNEKIQRWDFDDGGGYHPLDYGDWCKSEDVTALEAENERLGECATSEFAQRCGSNAELKCKIKQLRAELWVAKDDSKRLDWIDRYMDCTLAGPGLHISKVEIGDRQTLRQAIDEAMEKTK